jgi:uncharacterized YccA/Bax inhibitor family protein
MALTRTANPALNKKTFQGFSVSAESETMTLQGTVSKIIIMMLLVLAGAIYTWRIFFQALEGDPEAIIGNIWMFPMIGGIGGFIIALITIFRKNLAPYTAPVYSVLEGLLLGGISAIAEIRFPGIVIQAVSLTFGVLFALLFAYKTKLIKPTQNFRLGVAAATGGIFLVYLITFVLNLFGFNMYYLHNGSWLSIGFSLFVVIIAALNLVLDFDFIETGAEMGAPKFMEWYAAFGLMVTFIWLYIEILRLLIMIAARRE